MKNANQSDLFGNSLEQISKDINLENAAFYFDQDFFNKTESDKIYQSLKEDIAWKHDSIKMYGKDILLPRLSAWYGDRDKGYVYSGIKNVPLTWNDILLQIKTKVEKIADVEFNSVLINRYRDGKDYMGWHTDSEKELGLNPVIASVNFGATRKFQLRRMDDHKNKTEFKLSHGSLLIMKGETQHYWQHQVPKTTLIVGERINLTFRVIK